MPNTSYKFARLRQNSNQKAMGKRKMQVSPVSALFLLSFIVNATAIRPAPAPGPTTTQSGKHYLLVHGVGHGAWCWYKIVALLKSYGNNVTAIDLAASGINLQDVSDVKWISEYFQPLNDFMNSLRPQEKVIMVGHSYGGYATAYAMEQFTDKISAAVFLAAAMPGPNLNVTTITEEANAGNAGQEPQSDIRYIYDNGTNNPPTAYIFGPISLKTSLYQLTPIKDYELALLLVRPQPLFSIEDMSNVIRPTPQRYGTIYRCFMVTEFDMVLPPHFQRFMIERNPPNEVLQINGTDHMAMFTKPVELADALQSIGAKYS